MHKSTSDFFFGRKGVEGSFETISGWWWGSSEWVITGRQWVQVKCCLVKWNGVDVALFIIGPL